ncbi:MAG TPA: ATP-binding protein [Bryobacteraceae bacterium]|nr:ATP-binding protein [Bryobacteraceae bacterium]
MTSPQPEPPFASEFACRGGVLIVEDEAITALYLRQQLEQLGCSITSVVGSGEEALRTLDERDEAQRPAVILMDIKLSGKLTGTETAKIVQERFRIPVVYLSAHSDSATLKELEGSGEQGFLTKPVRPRDLFAVMQLAIFRHEQQKEQRKAWEEFCRRSRDQLDQFTYAAGHDLQEPLRTATAFVELLARRSSAKLDEEDRYLLKEIKGGLTRMNTLLQDLLGYAQAGLSDGAPVPEGPSEAALDWAKENLREAIAESRATITHGPLPVVRADPSQLVQVFQNLLANAIKYRRSDCAPQVEITAHNVDDAWLWRVRDNGIGFEAQYAEAIFAPFKRLHGQQTFPGTGIGLAICRKIIEAHGGRIWAESSPDQGSVFSFTLPR